MSFSDSCYSITPPLVDDGTKTYDFLRRVALLDNDPRTISDCDMEVVNNLLDFNVAEDSFSASVFDLGWFDQRDAARALLNREFSSDKKKRRLFRRRLAVNGKYLKEVKEAPPPPDQQMRLERIRKLAWGRFNIFERIALRLNEFGGARIHWYFGSSHVSHVRGALLRDDYDWVRWRLRLLPQRLGESWGVVQKRYERHNNLTHRLADTLDGGAGLLFQGTAALVFGLVAGPWFSFFASSAFIAGKLIARQGLDAVSGERSQFSADVFRMAAFELLQAGALIIRRPLIAAGVLAAISFGKEWTAKNHLRVYDSSRWTDSLWQAGTTLFSYSAGLYFSRRLAPWLHQNLRRPARAPQKTMKAAPPVEKAPHAMADAKVTVPAISPPMPVLAVTGRQARLERMQSYAAKEAQVPKTPQKKWRVAIDRTVDAGRQMLKDGMRPRIFVPYVVQRERLADSSFRGLPEEAKARMARYLSQLARGLSSGVSAGSLGGVKTVSRMKGVVFEGGPIHAGEKLRVYFRTGGGDEGGPRVLQVLGFSYGEKNQEHVIGLIRKLHGS